MGSSDIPPPYLNAPPWLIPVHMFLLGTGVLLWDATYILMTLRALRTKSYGMPLLALGANVSWELVTVFYVCEAPLETFGFFVWLVLDVGLVYTTVRYGAGEWKGSRFEWVGRRIGRVLAGLVAVGCVLNYWFAKWWLEVPGRGTGSKEGKWWGGKEGYDTTELAFWSAGASQVVLSVGSLVMLVSRGHSGGTSHAIWFCRSMGTLTGLVLCNIVMWWCWPNAHQFVFTPLGTGLWGLSLACDLVYPFVLHRVRQTEIVLPSGQVVSGHGKRDPLTAVNRKKDQ
ncbi:hypothetical protein B0T16DRAFT_336788 [Cercophora newfieldiana]|uniref:Uncharacterized protein n=1 Tax=Cercophora newfieldiana TaxID=92897 RepID=A0AA39XVQ6_9PEZI|nr:hypothetical protein B0T16DRAFT_336788 [Cercophora newfieldiana]